jgi:hypothetical protein
MENIVINPEVFQVKLEKMKNSGNPLMKRMAEAIEKHMKINNILNK